MLLKINASSLGAIVGCNKYKSRGQLIKQLLFSQEKKYTQSKLPPSHPVNVGKNMERSIIDMYEEKYSVKCYKADIKRKNYEKWTVSGRCDGITSDGKLIEVKCRMNTIQQFIPENDYAQIQAYLQLYDMNVCDYVQCLYDEKLPHVQQVKRDDMYWNETVMPKIAEFESKYRLILQDEDFKREILYFI